MTVNYTVIHCNTLHYTVEYTVATAWGQNNSWSMEMASQILPFIHPEFSAIIKMTGHFFLNNWK